MVLARASRSVSAAAIVGSATPQRKAIREPEGLGLLGEILCALHDEGMKAGRRVRVVRVEPMVNQ